MNDLFTNDLQWIDVIRPELDKPYMKNIKDIIEKTKNVCPNPGLVYTAFKATPFEKVKVVILGQDPYHDGNADGLAFSCALYKAPSLSKIYEAVDHEIKKKERSINLYNWATQGVFLLNTCLTTIAGQAHGHSNIGWQNFTSKAIEAIAANKNHIVFMLWGNYAHEYEKLINYARKRSGNIREHLIIKAEHPASASHRKRAWLDNHCFKACNDYLTQNNIVPIEW